MRETRWRSDRGPVYASESPKSSAIMESLLETKSSKRIDRRFSLLRPDGYLAGVRIRFLHRSWL